MFFLDLDPERFPLGPSDPHEFAHHEFQRRVRLRSRRSKLSVSSSWKGKNISPLAFHYLSVRTGVLGGFLSLIVALSSRGEFDWPCGRGGRREVFNLGCALRPSQARRSAHQSDFGLRATAVHNHQQHHSLTD